MNQPHITPRNIKVVAIDADDTLWDCQSHFDAVERRYCELLAAYAPAHTISASLFAVETANMPSLGYGTKAFTLSLIENAVAVTGGKVSGEEIGRIVEMGKQLLSFPTTPLPEVAHTLAQLRALHAERGLRVVAFTKGELQDQQNKLLRSGLADFFDEVVIVSDKTVEEYRQLIRLARVMPEELVMMGNSFKSDIAPALEAGAWALHIPYHVTWKMEHAETFDHPRLTILSHFGALMEWLNGTR